MMKRPSRDRVYLGLEGLRRDVGREERNRLSRLQRRARRLDWHGHHLSVRCDEEDVSRDGECLIQRHRVPPDPVVERLAGNELHHQEAAAVRSLQAMDGGMWG